MTNTITLPTIETVDWEKQKQAMVEMVQHKTGLPVTEAILEGGQWKVFINGYGWRTTTDALKGELR